MPALGFDPTKSPGFQMNWLKPGEKEILQAQYDEFCEHCDIECPSLETFLIAMCSVYKRVVDEMDAQAVGLAGYRVRTAWKKRMEDMLGS